MNVSCAPVPYNAQMVEEILPVATNWWKTNQADKQSSCFPEDLNL